ncbi:DUF2079 domain-containing protein [Arthrobacter sp. CAN_C5]|uniref:DUF2079 domain-containing protein n=1 Tax=Arthrobacter sp. CAN_C5 TaxID=2760706 RepID=UPI001AE6D358|nr:DUF2079 domain-containing protein [Arthrobacter sp. CAN_C5]MBP2215446.1 putative membrane protein [Arthrobacter sp. CAN_C5]
MSVQHSAHRHSFIADGLRSTGSAFRRQPPAALITALTVTIIYTVFSVAQWNRMDTPSWDLGIFTQLAKAYAGFDAPIVPIKGDGFNLLGDHFHPLLVLLGPAYAFFPSGLTLLVLQNILIGASVLVIARLGIRRLGTVAGICLGVAYGLSWGLQTAVAAQFHEIAIAIPLLALALEAMINGRLRAAVVWAGLLVFVKEDLGLTVAAIGLVIAWRHRDRIGLWLAAWGLGWMLLSVAVILPLLNSGGQYDYSDRIDVRGMLADPVGAVVTIFSASAKYETVWLLLLAGGVLFLRSPLTLIMVPTLAWRFVAENPVYWGTEWHYSAVLMPVLFAALIDAIDTSRRSERRWVRAAGTAVVPAVTVVALLLLPTQPLAALADPETYRQSERWETAQRLMDQIPEGATVETGVVLMPYLVPHTEVFWLGSENPPPDFLIVDTQDWSWGPTHPEDAAAHAEDTYPGESYEPVFQDDGYQMVRRNG